MRSKNRYFPFVLTLMIFYFGTGFSVRAQDEIAKDSKSDDKVELVKSRNFTFVAQSATPAAGRLRQLTTMYTLQVKNDTVISFLPYFGRAYVGPLDPTEIGLEFTTVAEQWIEKEGKKNSIEVKIVPKNAKDVRDMYLSVFKSGSATLRVNSNNRQPISFNGYVDMSSK